VRCVDEHDAVYRGYVAEMDRRIAESQAHAQVAEVGIGGNALARLSGIIMEDEAVRDTCHVCFGDNARYGGTNPASWHGGTVVVLQPRFEMEGAEICPA
jgi:leucyl aminopeptidase (aminopeptidase T)